MPGLIGRRLVRLTGLPRGWALKSVRARGLDVTDVAEEGVEIVERADASGAFSVNALPPGGYFAVAVPVLADGEWAELAYLEGLEMRAIRFTLSEGESKNIGLRVGVGVERWKLGVGSSASTTSRSRRPRIGSSS